MVWSGSTTAPSGDKQVLMNMTKKGDKHLWTLFIHGAPAVVRVATNNNDGSQHQWVCKHTRFSSTHFLRFPGFQPSAGTLPVSGYSGIRGGARRYIHQASAL